MWILVSYGVGEPLSSDQVSSCQVEDVEYYYPSLSPATTATALYLELTIDNIELSVHGVTASKLDDHAKLLASP